MHKKYTLLLLLAFFTNALCGQEAKDTVKTLEFLKKFYKDTAYLVQFFEEDLKPSKFFSNPLTEVNWNKTYSEQDLTRITEDIKNTITFDVGKEKGALLIVPDTSKAYQHLSVVFSLPEGVDKEFIDVYFEPTKILVANKSVGMYPKDRAAKFNESGFFSHDGQYIQRIPISILKSEEISGRIQVEGILEVSLAAKMAKLELVQNKNLTTVQNKSYELLALKNGKGYVRVNHTKKESFKDKDYKLRVDGEGMKNFENIVTIPYECYDYLSKGLQYLDFAAYNKMVDSFTYTSFEKEDKVLLLYSRSLFDEIVLFSPDNIFTIEENISKSTLNFGEEIEVRVDRLHQWENEDTSRRTVDLTLDVMGLISRPDNYIKLKEITQAIDNTGKLMEYRPFFNNYNKDSKVSVNLGAPAAAATSIASVQGILKYFHPTIENKGKIPIKDPLSKTNTNLLMSIDKEVQLYLLRYEDHQELIRQKEEESNRLAQEKTQIEQAQIQKTGFNTENRKELQTKYNQLSEAHFTAQRMVETIKSTFKDNHVPKENILHFYFHDPAEKLTDIIVYNENKKKINHSWSKNYDKIIISLEKPTTTLFLEVIIENQDACRDFPFEIKDIKLPQE